MTPINVMTEVMLAAYGNSLGDPPTRALVEALGAIGFVIVPKEPNEAMLDAGDELLPYARGTETHKIAGGKVPEDYYRAMVEAGQVKP